jgi:hypothetical protein
VITDHRLIIYEFGVANRGTKGTPHLFAAYSNHDVDILGGKGTIGND